LAKEKAPQKEALLEGLVFYGDFFLLITTHNLSDLFGFEMEVET